MAQLNLEHLNQSLEHFPDLGYVVVPHVLASEEAHELYDAFDVIRLRKAGERPSTNVANERGFVRDARFVRMLSRQAGHQSAVVHQRGRHRGRVDGGRARRYRAPATPGHHHGERRQ
jgi:hypothetical protein